MFYVGLNSNSKMSRLTRPTTTTTTIKTSPHLGTHQDSEHDEEEGYISSSEGI